MTETLASAIARLNRLDARRNADGLPMNEYRDLSGDIADIAVPIIRRQAEMLEMATVALTICANNADVGLIDAKVPRSAAKLISEDQPLQSEDE